MSRFNQNLLLFLFITFFIFLFIGAQRKLALGQTYYSPVDYSCQVNGGSGTVNLNADGNIYGIATMPNYTYSISCNGGDCTNAGNDIMDALANSADLATQAITAVGGTGPATMVPASTNGDNVTLSIDLTDGLQASGDSSVLGGTHLAVMADGVATCRVALYADAYTVDAIPGACQGACSSGQIQLADGSCIANCTTNPTGAACAGQSACTDPTSDACAAFCLSNPTSPICVATTCTNGGGSSSNNGS